MPQHGKTGAAEYRKRDFGVLPLVGNLTLPRPEPLPSILGDDPVSPRGDCHRRLELAEDGNPSEIPGSDGHHLHPRARRFIHPAIRLENHRIAVPFGDCLVAQQHIDVQRLLGPLGPPLRPQLRRMAEVASPIVKQLPRCHALFYVESEVFGCFHHDSTNDSDVYR